ncbi:chorismate mutase [Tahibacter sp. UC22_41]|uniref:chorismate mutase n=1 Tax=Tahibacter sp. UC22_41 TaxID=3350178 RepID=UPI0036DC1F18
MIVRKPSLLAVLRGAVDLVDDGLIALLAARRGLVRAIATVKTRAGLPALDAAREQSVHRRAQTLARRLGVPAATARNLIDLVVTDARRQQHAVRCEGLPAKPRPAAATTVTRARSGSDGRAGV